MILTAFYDLEHGPVSFDFITWLVRAMKERDQRGCKGLHVVIVPKEDGLGGFSRNWGKHDEHAARWRLWHILVAACPLAGATVTVAATRHQAHRHLAQEPFWWPEGKAHLMGPLVASARKGEAIPKLKATEAARRYVTAWTGAENYVTLTVRNQTTDPDRNSNAAAWLDLSQMAVKAGYKFVWLDDSNVALSQGRGYAELDPDLRLALYERAAMNFIGNNGPQELLKFSDAPYLVFGVALTDGWKEHFRKHFGMQPGEQVPWAGPHQKIVYEPDTSQVLLREFAAWALETN